MIVALAPLHDHVVDEDGTSVVMVGNEITVLSPLATGLVALLREGPQALHELAYGLVDAFGSPGEDHSAVALVQALVVDLRRRGVVRVVTAE